MMSASALMFGKWFPAALVGLFAVVGASLTLLWKGAGGNEAARRRGYHVCSGFCSAFAKGCNFLRLQSQKVCCILFDERNGPACISQEIWREQ